MSTKSLPATEVKNRFGRVLREIAKTGGPIVIERDGNPVAVMLSISEYTRMQPRTNPTVEQIELLKASFGIWRGRKDIDDDWLADGRSRWQSSWSNE